MGQTEPIKFTQHGIPQINEYTASYIKGDKDRPIKVPEDINQEACNELFKFLRKFDELMISTWQKQIFGKNYKKYRYLPLVKEVQEDDEDDEDDENDEVNNNNDNNKKKNKM